MVHKAAHNDENTYTCYAEHINPSYPDFLRRLGLKSVAMHAEGAIITDSNGKQYIDCTAGYGLFNLGHNHPSIVQALTEQLHSKQPLTRPLISEIHTRFVTRLISAVQNKFDCVFICNSGSEAVDSALKLARLCGRKKKIIAAKNSFHGYTYGALSVTGIKKFRLAFEPMLPDIEFIDYGSLDAASKAINDETTAIILEPVQHEAGIHIPPSDYFHGVRELCNKHDALFILDEVKTGMGKTGLLFAHETMGVTPDILILGKSLGGGLMPSGAILSNKKLWKRFGLSFPMSASSYAGNTLTCRAGIATLDVFEHTNILEASRNKGELLSSHLASLSQKHQDIIKKNTGTGLLHSLTLNTPQLTFELAKQLIQHGVLAVPAFGNNTELMLEPPLVITQNDLLTVCQALDTSLNTLH